MDRTRARRPFARRRPRRVGICLADAERRALERAAAAGDEEARERLVRVAARTGEVAALDALLARRALQGRLSLGEVVRSVVEGSRSYEVRGGGSFLRLVPTGDEVQIGAGEAPPHGVCIVGGRRTGVMSNDAVVVIPLRGEGAAPTASVEGVSFVLSEESLPGPFPVQEELRLTKAGAQAWLEAHGHVGPRAEVRRRPAMYLGRIDGRGVREVLEQLIERVIDERHRGSCSRLDVAIHDEDRLRVEDDGAGSGLGLLAGESPGDPRPIPTTLGQGLEGDFDDPGMNAVRAVSERFETDAVVGSRRLVVVHERGVCVRRAEEPVGDRRGVRLDVRLDRTILAAGLDPAWIRSRLDEVAHLLPGLRVTFDDAWRSTLALDVVRSGGLGDLLVGLGVSGALDPPISGRCARDAADGRWEVKIALLLARSVADLGQARTALAARLAGVADHIWPEPEPPAAREGVRLAFANERPVSPRGAIGRGLEAGLSVQDGWQGRGLWARLAVAVQVRTPPGGLQFAGSTRWDVGSPEVEPLVRDAVKDAIETATRERPEQVARALRPQTGS